MHFLVDQGITPLACHLLRRHGHSATHVCDAQLRGAEDDVLAAVAKERSFAILTLDFDFGDIRRYPPEQYVGIVVLELPPVTSRRMMLRLLEVVITDRELIENLPGRLAIAQLGRILRRPPLS